METLTPIGAACAGIIMQKTRVSLDTGKIS